jgi:ankyrin repeat protein
LHHAAKQGDLSLLLRLRDAGADVEECNHAGNNPLHLAAKSGNPYLIHHLATPTTMAQQNRQGFTPLQTALVFKQWMFAVMLVAQGAYPYGPDDSTPSISSLAAL